MLPSPRWSPISSHGELTSSESFADDLFDVARLLELWLSLRDLPRPPHDAMCHGDLVPGNVVVRAGRLAGVLDGGGLAPADPPLDLVAAHRRQRRRPDAGGPGEARAGPGVIVVDATVWVDLLRGELDDHLQESVVGDLCVAAPHVDFEVGFALIRAERRGVLPDGAAVRLVRAFVATPCRREYDRTDPVRALRYRDNATYADAWYLAMASRLSCPVVTIDSRMLAAASAHDIDVIGP